MLTSKTLRRLKAIVEPAVSGPAMVRHPGFGWTVLVVDASGSTLLRDDAFAFWVQLPDAAASDDRWLVVVAEHHETEYYHETDVVMYREFVQPGRALPSATIVPVGGGDERLVLPDPTRWTREGLPPAWDEAEPSA